MNLISEDDACPSPACVTIELATIGKAIINEQK